MCVCVCVCVCVCGEKKPIERHCRTFFNLASPAKRNHKQSIPRVNDDCLLTEDDHADAVDTYDSDTDAAAYGGDEL